MTQNTQKSTSHWTDKHTKFALKNGVKHIASLIWKWILTQGKEGTEIELCLKDYQKYVTKHQGSCSELWYVKKRFNQLASLRIIHIEKVFGSHWYRIHLRHPLALEPKKPLQKKLTKPVQISDLQPSNQQNSVAGINSSSNPDINDIKEVSRRYEILKLCGKHGIYFDPRKDTTEVLFNYDLEDIKSALNHFNKRGGHRKIRDSKAWLIDCLDKAYWIDSSFDLGDFLTVMAEMFSNIPVP